MMDVAVRGRPSEVRALAAHGNALQEAFHFHAVSREDAAVLHLEPGDRGRLWSVSRGGGVVLSTWQSREIAAYAGMTQAGYLLVGALLGLVQWRALWENPVLRGEDFIHEEPPRCLYVPRLLIEDYAVAFEHPWVCPSCWQFYSFLIPRAEVAALRRAVAFAAAAPWRGVCPA
ncbi:MAG: hypothetical protein ACLFTT_15065 [Candidatus Hydrogenedentota bacterium]